MAKLKDLLPILTERPCRPGETSAKTGCTPASGGGGKKPPADEEPKKDGKKEEPKKDGKKEKPKGPVKKSSSKSPYGAKQAGIGVGASKLTGPKDDSDSVAGDAKAENAVIEKIRAMGTKEDPDLCTVQVPGSNLFCEGNKNIPRDEMPQLKSKPLPGSKAAKLVASGELKLTPQGEVNTEAMFKKKLKERDPPVETSEPKPMNVADLKATQNQLVGGKVKMFAEVLGGDFSGDENATTWKDGPNKGKPYPDHPTRKKEPLTQKKDKDGNPKWKIDKKTKKPKLDKDGNKIPDYEMQPNNAREMKGWQDNLREPIMISEDGYILDGHHRWAALVQHDLANGGGSDVEMDVKQVNMGAKELVDATNEFTNEMGLEVKAAASSKKDGDKKKKNESFTRLSNLVREILSTRM